MVPILLAELTTMRNKNNDKNDVDVQKYFVFRYILLISHIY